MHGQSLVRDLIQVFGADEAQAHSDVLLARLAEQWPDTYAGMKPAALTVALRHYGVETRQLGRRMPGAAAPIAADQGCGRGGHARTPASGVFSASVRAARHSAMRAAVQLPTHSVTPTFTM